MSNPDKGVLDKNAMTRISLIMGIDKALHPYFGPVADHWITNPNDGPLFEGASPIEYMVTTDILGIYELRRMLDSWSAGH